MTELIYGGGAGSASPDDPTALQRYVSWFHELDAWTEYWDIYHPETSGHFYFGNGGSETGLLTRFLPRDGRPLAFLAWTKMALGADSTDHQTFADEVRVPEVAAAVMEVDDLLSRLFTKHFGDASDGRIRADYLEAIFRFALNSLPPATERDARISDDDPRKSTAGRHTLEGDIMWFAWALHTEAAHAIVGANREHPRRALFLAGVATGCPANFAWRGHRRTRSEYQPDEQTAALLRQRGLEWATNFEAAAREIHALFRIREWGHEA
jgi:hypothetical protein